MSRQTKWLWALGGFLLLGWLVILSPELGQARAIERKLEANARRALATAGESWAEVHARGRTLVLSGLAPSEAARASVRALAAGSSGAQLAGLWGGVGRLEDRTALIPFESPYRLTITRTLLGGVAIEGGAPDPYTRERIVSRAHELFPSGVTDKVRLARGAPDGADWAGAARFALDQLAELREGTARLEDVAFRLDGEAVDRATALRVERAVKRPPAPFAGVSMVKPAAKPAALWDPKGPALEGRGPCQELFEQLLREGAVRFDPGGPALAPESAAILDRLAGAAQRCGGFDLSIEVHVAGTGNRAADEALSYGRAQGLLEGLAARGVARARMVAEGLGALAGAGEAGRVAIKAIGKERL